MTTFRRALLSGAAAALLCVGGVQAQDGAKPQYGGTLEVGTMFVTLSALSWDPHDWNWKLNHDTGQFYEQLIAGDLDKSVRKGGKHPFVADAYLATEAQRGELAEKWELVENPLSVVFTLRKGIMFPEKPGVMPSRELTAEDVAYAFNRLRSSPKHIGGYYDFVGSVVARDKYTVVFNFKEYNAEWDYRLAWGFYTTITPKEVVDAGPNNWKNVNGTGPFMLTDFVAGNSNTYTKNPIYWDKEKLGGQEYKLPFVDKLVYRTIKDEATQLAAIRTAKLDLLETINARYIPELKKSAPQLQFAKRLSILGSFMALRTDTKPFDDIRVRRAINMAVNKKEIIEAHYTGEAEMHAYPMYPDWDGYYDLARQDAGLGEGALCLQSEEGEGAAEGSWLSQRLHLQDAVLLLLARPFRAGAAHRRLSRAGRHQGRAETHRVRCVPVGHDDAQARGRLSDEQQPHQSRRPRSARASSAARPGIRRCIRMPSSTPRWTRSTRPATRPSASSSCAR